MGAVEGGRILELFCGRILYVQEVFVNYHIIGRTVVVAV